MKTGEFTRVSKSILITGGTGSLGRALTKHLITDDSVSRVVIYSRDEFKQGMMSPEFPSPKLRFFLGDVRDRDRLAQAMVGVDEVIHAAALKRVDSVAYNPSEVIKTNVTGTMNVIEAACGRVGKVIVISSDKAVQPTNIYGISKAAAESYAVHSNSFTYPQGTKVSVVRYGNVLGSRGSVVHIFREAVAKGDPIPITDPDCTRFFITMSQAVKFVLGCMECMEGAEIFVPNLPSAEIGEVATAVAYGHPWKLIGLRHGGEKMHESLMGPEEIDRARACPMGWMIYPAMHPWRKEFPVKGERAPFTEYISVDDLDASQIRSLLIQEGLIEDTSIGGSDGGADRVSDAR